jgi:hypothetical protein
MEITGNTLGVQMNSMKNAGQIEIRNQVWYLVKPEEKEEDPL